MTRTLTSSARLLGMRIGPRPVLVVVKGDRNRGNRRPLVLALQPNSPPGLPVERQSSNAGLTERRLPIVPTGTTGVIGYPALLHPRSKSACTGTRRPEGSSGATALGPDYGQRSTITTLSNTNWKYSCTNRNS